MRVVVQACEATVVGAVAVLDQTQVGVAGNFNVTRGRTAQAAAGHIQDTHITLVGAADQQVTVHRQTAVVDKACGGGQVGVQDH